jgi:MoaA/NifB/PqqE/SkfB family radical SAM enzyme
MASASLRSDWTTRITDRAKAAGDAMRRGRNPLRAPDGYPGTRLTLKRRLNLYLLRVQQWRGDTRLFGYPIVLTVETGNLCNLRCPYCFTGAGEVGRGKSAMSMDLFRGLMDELGDRLLMVELYNWGEPLLNKDLEEMVALAHRKGVSTFISTNLSLRPPVFDAARAERLVKSGLSILGCSIDGATQEAYEKYRVRGDLQAVLDNVRLVAEAKRKLGSSTPQLVWEYHVFPHNRHEVEEARRLADELGMTFAVSKGWIPGEDWDRNAYEWLGAGRAQRCDFLWQRAVVHNDGGVSACCGLFYKEDDFGSVRREPAVPLSALAHEPFRSVWNNKEFREARGLFGRHVPTNGGSASVCSQCPATLMWQGYRRHIEAGGSPSGYVPPFSSNDGFNFFLQRAPSGKDRGELPEARQIIQLIDVAE